MDSNIDSCAYLFTLGQRERVMQRIAAFWATLVSAANLAFTGCEPLTGIEEREQAPWLALNPATDHVRIAGEGGAQLALFTTGGQLVRTLSAAPHERVDLSDLPTGSYLVRMTTPQAVRVVRLVVMR
ncbi:MAG: T9SS type A sorting domain-containing protein [Flavobacteriales bacterium]